MKFKNKVSYLLNMNKYYLLFIIFCLTGCLYQVYQVAEVYLAYRTKVDILLESNNQFKVPLVTFCKSRLSLIKNELLRKFLIESEVSLTPESIDNSTFGI